MPYFFGMRDTGDWVSNQRPESWEEMILRLFPNGSAPLTAMLAKMKQKNVTDPIHHWWRKTLPTQRVTGTAGAFVYTDVLSTPYVSGGAAAATLYVKMTAADVAQIKIGHTVLFRCSTDYTLDVVARVTARAVNGASSYATVTLLEADDNGTGTTIANADVLLIMGTAYGQGGLGADAIAQDVVEDYNYCQIFKDALQITKTAEVTKLRTGAALPEAQRDCLEYFSIQREKAYLWGIRYAGTDPVASTPMYTTGGIIRKLSSNVDDFSVNTDYSGQTWLQGGEDWFDAQLEQIFRYGRTQKLAFCGSGALLGIQKLAKTNGNIQLTPQVGAYGIAILNWITPFGTLSLKTHPLFSYEATNRNSMLIIEPENLTRIVLRGTKFEMNIQPNDADYTKHQYLCEDGLELNFEETFGYLNGVGVDSSL